MDFDDSVINSASRNPLDVVQSKSNEPTITFSPNRTRFDSGLDQNCKSRNASIASDFDLNLGVSYSTTDIQVNQFQNQPPSTSLTDDLLSEPPLPTPLSQLNSNSKSGVNTINKFNLDLKQDISLSVSHNQSQQSVSNDSIAGSGGIGPSMSNLISLVTPQTKGEITRKMSNSYNGIIQETEMTTSSNSNSALVTSTVQLQKKLEKKIAQASAIAAAMNSMAPSHSTSPSTLHQKDESEFGDWNISTETPSNSNSSPPSKPSKSPQHIINPSITTTDPALSSKSLSKSKSFKTANATKNRYSTDDRAPACVKFQENEVEIISKSSRAKVSGALIPPERLAVPHKSLPSNNSSNNRRHSSSTVDGGGRSGSQMRDDSNGDAAGGAPNTGSTSEVKPLVEWDSDDSEEELSFFPTGKPKAKLTDNLSIDNMSLSGEEDDLHLSPPRHISQKCPCDPRQWIGEHVMKIPKSNSFSGQGGQCLIS